MRVADVSHLNKPKMNSIISRRYATPIQALLDRMRSPVYWWLC